jgi:hypothetical protein
MTNLFIKIVNILKADVTLTAIVPATQIFVGPVDVTVETQAQLLMPQINLFMVSEVTRTVPKNVKDTTFQISIWSRNSQLEVETMYERILTLLNYLVADQSTNHIFWERSSGAVDDFEADRRVWHRSVTFTAWVQ